MENSNPTETEPEMLNELRQFHRENPKRTYIALGVFLALFFLLIQSCGGSDKTEIEAVLRSDARTTEGENVTVEIIVDRMMAIDLSDCPADFREAYVRHIGTWEGLEQQIMMEPQGIGETLLHGFMRGLGGDLSGGGNEINDARRYWLHQIQSTFTEVRAIASRYGVDPNKFNPEHAQ